MNDKMIKAERSFVSQVFINTLRTRLLVASLAVFLSATVPGQAQSKDLEIDVEHSTITLHVFKTGLFSFAGDNHEIHAPIAGGVVNESAKTVELKVETAKLTVLDPGLSPDKRMQVQQEMLGPNVLDSRQFPEIRFHASQMTQEKPGEWRITGDLALHGKTRQITLRVTGSAGHYHGTASLKQTDFGITPVSVAGGTIKVKDAINVDFDIALRQAASGTPKG
jgi:polyisoprenoid-binding protein YceI